MQPFLDSALEAAAAASRPILARFHDRFEVEIKEDATPVTAADREAEQEIRRVLSTAFPAHGIYGEEFGTGEHDSEYLWLVDPIDGTKSFIRGLDMFSIQVALMHRGEIVLGVSSAPATGELAWAVRGEGAWLDGTRLEVSGIDRLDRASLSTGNLFTLAGDDRWAALGRIVRKVDRVRGYGDYYHYHRLAQGQLDAVVESDVNVLDIAALSLIVEEAGGVFTDLEGARVGLETRSVLAATPGLHAALLDALKLGRWS